MLTQRFVKLFGAVCCAGLLAIASTGTRVSAHSSLTGVGTATIDGVLAPGEWDGAATLDFAVNLPGGGTTPGRFYVMNDAANLYLAVRFARSSVDPANSLVFEFDNGGGFYAEGSDVVVHNPAAGFFDDIRTSQPPCPPTFVCGLFDVDLGGTNDGEGGFANDGVYSVYEISHPLDSADDAHDFSLHGGDHVGVLGQLYLLTSTDYGFTSWGPLDLVISPVDADGDGVVDAHDACPGTPAGSVVDAAGCSIEQLVPCAGPWRNHGDYVSRITHEADRFAAAGLIDGRTRAAIVSLAARSTCGKGR